VIAPDLVELFKPEQTFQFEYLLLGGLAQRLQAICRMRGLVCEGLAIHGAHANQTGLVIFIFGHPQLLHTLRFNLLPEPRIPPLPLVASHRLKLLGVSITVDGQGVVWMDNRRIAEPTTLAMVPDHDGVVRVVPNRGALPLEEPHLTCTGGIFVFMDVAALALISKKKAVKPTGYYR
jgi:hypothetical protein